MESPAEEQMLFPKFTRARFAVGSRLPLVLGIISLVLAVVVPVGYMIRLIPYTDNLLVSFALIGSWGQFLIAGIAFLLQARDARRGVGFGWMHHLWALPAALLSIPVASIVNLTVAALLAS